MVLGALAALLETQPDIAVCARAANGREALAAVGKHKPDVLVTDIEMPEMTGLTLAGEVRDRYPQTRVMIRRPLRGPATCGARSTPGQRAICSRTGRRQNWPTRSGA